MARRPRRFATMSQSLVCDHMTKHVFIIPGIVLAYVLRGIYTENLIASIIFGLISATCIAAANYVINEWLDREFDKFHPSKSQRTAVNINLNNVLVYAEYAVLVVIGLATATIVGFGFFIVSVAFVVSGIIYNVRPFRTKDHAFVDVLSESLNNPIRLMLGWAIVDPTTLPPAVYCSLIGWVAHFSWLPNGYRNIAASWKFKAKSCWRNIAVHFTHTQPVV